jgi:hypothetical protein
VPQLTGLPQLSVPLPQLLNPQLLLVGVQLHVPPLHVFGAVHVHETIVPHESMSEPQLVPLQGEPLGVQPHLLATPPPAHVFGAAQGFPQSTEVPQLLVVTPHSTFEHVVDLDSGTHAQAVGEPVQLSPAPHAVHRETS